MIKQREITSDGSHYNGDRDPPGQVIVYIAPGDSRREQYRLATFQCFPKDSAVRPTDLAAGGFHYIGYRDRVKCFSCGAAIENWVVGDNPADRRWHKSTCDFACMRETQNIPMPKSSDIFKNFLERRPRNPTSSSSANSLSSHQMATTPTSTQTMPIPLPLQNSSNLPPVPVEDLQTCRNPMNPHMRSLASRISTFNDRRGIRWPVERIRATPEELANAGLFYIGERDRVKCWYCNGGLQNWDYNDDPWVEHAKWFPSCEYVRNSKGTSFIEQVASQNPNLTPIAQSRDRNNDVATKVQEAITQLDYVAKAREMEIDIEIITQILTQKYRQDGVFYREEAQFFDAVFASGNLPNEGLSSVGSSNAENIGQIDLNSKEPTGSKQPAILSQQSAAEAPRMEEELVSQLRSLTETRLCRICKQEVSDTVIIPCGHICTCHNCIDNVTNCPLCGATKTETIRTYRA